MVQTVVRPARFADSPRAMSDPDAAAPSFVSADAAGAANAGYIDAQYARYKQNPADVGTDWQAFFAGFELASGGTGPAPAAAPDSTPGVGVFDLVHTYREFGHLEATLDPLGDALGTHRGPHQMLALENFNLADISPDTQVGAGGFLGETDGTLGDLVDKLKAVYTRNVGVEFTAIDSREQRKWLQERMEPTLNQPHLSKARQLHVLRQLVAAEEFEQYLHRTFVGKKRFSVEGGDATIPLLNTIIEQAPALGGEQVICSMAHRGRLNVLAHVLEKPLETILAEFAGTIPHNEEINGDGDVKYHLGYANNRRVKPDAGVDADSVKVSLLPNPSHLELINPIQQGIIRCKQEWMLDGDRKKVVPVCLHGDAAFCGQGIVFETLNLSELVGYRTGGTIHVIVNNQIGFTTPPRQGRFTPYPTDVAKAIQAPVFHVNGDDPEAVVHVAELAIAFRQEFKQDVFIDLWCYRRHGHNEQDEASFTQPRMYAAIKKHPTVRELYEKRLLDGGIVTKQEVEEIKTHAIDRLKEAREAASVEKPRGKVPSFSGVWQGMRRAPDDYREWDGDTTADEATLRRVVATLNQIPEKFNVQRKVARIMKGRVDAVESGEGIDWGTGEMLAFGSLLHEGTDVRVTGQDVERGTFSHRHAVLHDAETGDKHRPLQHLGGGKKHQNQGRFAIINTMLSEEAVVGFEWGFSSADPRNLVVWEAQFGDFVNGAQNVIDQILAAAESKWRYMNGLVMNLPHGYEGQGPEHSNAYLERFLALCAEHNMQVAAPTTPAQYFHLLRRQIRRDFRKPLVLMTPKSLLRLPEATNRLSDFTEQGLQLVIRDPANPPADSVRRVLLCSGKLFYALDKARREAGTDAVAIVRVEQLYPWPEHEIKAAVRAYRKASEVVWVQEEPANRGAWSFAQPRLRELFPDRLVEYRGRSAAASPATGSTAAHEREEAALLASALELPSDVAAGSATPAAAARSADHGRS
jgi:2-oxoglutarate dehydrogenase E1 component